MPFPARILSGDFSFGRCVIQSAARQLLIDGQAARLGARAFDVLMTLVERRDAVVSKNELLDTVWPGLVVEENNLQVQVSTLRKLLGPQTILTIPGRGYRFSVAQPDAADVQSGARGQESTGAAADGLGNLPAQLPPLFGRDAELAALAAMLRAPQPRRLITITGSGGIGKTRLAQAAALAANENKANYPDGVWLVEFAAVSDPQLVLGSIARTLGIALDADASADDLASRVTDHQMLVVLDNCEHLIEPVAAVALTLLRAAPKLQLLVTSQESLKLAEEQVLRLGTLSVPVDAAQDSPNEAVLASQSYGALALFAARAREALPHFALTADNRAAVIEICRRLDGIPLAIEFAAARLPLLGVEGLRLRLDDRFRLLTGGTRLAPRRQQTLRAALEWSHSLLSADEQKVFRRLGIFSGSFGLDAAQQVGSDGDFDSWTVLDHLGVLVDKSLVLSEGDAVPRYRLLESTRAFANEQLHAVNEAASAAQRHAESMRWQFEAAHAQLWTASLDTLLASCLADIDNLRAALAWAASVQGDARQLATLVAAAGWMWKSANLAGEGLGWYHAALDRIASDIPPAIEARVLLGYASQSHQKDATRELAALHRAHALFGNINDRRGQYEVLTTLAQKQVWLRDLKGAQASIDQASALLDSTWPPAMREGLLVARTFWFEVAGRAGEGQPLMEELVALMRATGDARRLDAALLNLAESLFVQGKIAETIVMRREVARRLQGRAANYAGGNLGNLCAALILAGELDAALRAAREALPLLQREGTLNASADHFALLACQLGQHAAAARVLGRMDANFSGSGFEREMSEARAARMTREVLQQALPTDDLQRMMQEGASMSDESVVRIALGLDRRTAARAL